MPNEKAVSANPSDRFDRVEMLLNLYPVVNEEDLDYLKRWFRKDASAFEVASMASKQPTGYASFRADHIDRLTGFDMAGIFVIVGAIMLGVLLFI
ncbi:hypothetical protein [Qipengyuania spongiae]|uniref:Anti-sigma factor n=1 Tax=Qipengyuania spongiae TaxID=2909673 RepID=A0ABY5SZ42_9SPHN|nr:hypothetical protein [Qipengyuania spongiae]UVI38341.1 hypothetical protein L1F33_08700 [Qipengyuania spongiae]